MNSVAFIRAVSQPPFPVHYPTLAWTRHMSPTFTSMIILEQEPIYSPALIHPAHFNHENIGSTNPKILAMLPIPTWCKNSREV
jgi:hypothetical protein